MIKFLSRILFLIVFLAAVNAAFCVCANAFSVDYDGDGVADAIGSVGNIPTPPPPTPVYNNSGSTSKTIKQQKTYQQKAPKPKPKALTSDQMAQQMITTTIFESLLSEIFAPTPTGPSPEEQQRMLEEQRRLEEEKLQKFLKSNADLKNRMKGFDAVEDKNTATVNAGGMQLKMPDTGALTHKNFFGSSGSVNPKVDLLREENPLESEFAAIRQSQERIDALRGKDGLTIEEQAELNGLIEKRNELWSRASARPDLTQEERERLKLRMYVAPKSDNDFMLDADALVAREKYSDPVLDVIGAAGKSGAESFAVGITEEGGKMILLKKFKKAKGYSTLLASGKWAVDTPKTTAEKVVTVVDFALDKAPALDAGIHAAGAGARQAVVRYWASSNSTDMRPVASAMDEWNSWYVDQGEWTRAALDMVGAGKFK